MEKKELIELLKQEAKALNVDWCILCAILMNENEDLRGIDPKTGRLRIRYEKHVEKRMLKKRIDPNEAYLLALSYGLPQIMGFNYALCGFKSVREMKEAFADEKAHLKIFTTFIKNSNPLYQAIKEKHFANISKLYNGAGYMKNNYMTRLITHYNKAKEWNSQDI